MDIITASFDVQIIETYLEPPPKNSSSPKDWLDESIPIFFV